MAKRITRKWILDEISAVPKPMMEGATADIMKAAPILERAPDSKTEKAFRLLSSVNGHSHLIDDEDQGGHTSYEKGDGDEFGHSHPYVRNTDGSITVGEADGHTHSVLAQKMQIDKRAFSAEQRKRLASSGAAMSDGSFPISNKSDLRNAISAFGRAKNQSAVAKHIAKRARALGATDLLPKDGKLADMIGKASPGDGALSDMVSGAQTAAGATGDGPLGDNMPTTTNAADKDQAAKVQKQLDDAQALAKHYERLAALNDAEKAHMGALPEPDRAAFLALDGDARKAELEKAADADPVVYTSSDGTQFRKSDDPRYVKLAKQADEDRKVAKAERDKREAMELEKRATGPDLEHYGAKPDVTAAMLKAIDGIEDENVRKAALDSMKAAASTNAAAFKTAGYRGTSDEDGDDPVVKLDKLAKAHAEKNGTSVAKGMSEVLKTDEGKALYSQTREENTTH